MDCKCENGKDEIKQAMLDFLMARRDALCRELSEVERQLEKLGAPVKNPKITKLT